MPVDRWFTFPVAHLATEEKGARETPMVHNHRGAPVVRSLMLQSRAMHQQKQTPRERRHREMSMTDRKTNKKTSHSTNLLGCSNLPKRRISMTEMC